MEAVGAIALNAEVVSKRLLAARARERTTFIMVRYKK
jgi:hypothetical protein